jgi:hypothetical protein
VKPLIACQYLELAGSGLAADATGLSEGSEMCGFTVFPIEIKGESLVGAAPGVNLVDLRAAG